MSSRHLQSDGQNHTWDRCTSHHRFGGGGRANAIEHRVAHVEIPEFKSISLRAKVMASSGNSPALIRRKRSRLSLAGRSRYGLGVAGVVRSSSCSPDLAWGQPANIGQPFLDQTTGKIKHLREIIRGV